MLGTASATGTLVNDDLNAVPTASVWALLLLVLALSGLGTALLRR